MRGQKAQAPATTTKSVATEDEEELPNQGEDEESWLDWLKRSTQLAKEARRRARVRSWSEEQKVRKWRWAGDLARQRPSRWSVKLCEWRPAGIRWRRGKPATRWEDELEGLTATRLGANAKDWRMLAAFKEE